MPRRPTKAAPPAAAVIEGYAVVLDDVVALLEDARGAAARAVNAAMTATYFAIGRRLVEEEQRGQSRAGYGEALVERLAADLSARFGRGFGRRNLFQMRAFYLAYREKVQPLAALSAGPCSPSAGITSSSSPSGSWASSVTSSCSRAA
jgi:hypothetical protein